MTEVKEYYSADDFSGLLEIRWGKYKTEFYTEDISNISIYKPSEFVGTNFLVLRVDMKNDSTDSMLIDVSSEHFPQFMNDLSVESAGKFNLYLGNIFYTRSLGLKN